MLSSTDEKFCIVDAVLSYKTPEEKQELAHVKRFYECWVGDTDFRSRLRDNLSTPQLVFADYGCEIDAEALRPIFDASYGNLNLDEKQAEWPVIARWRAYFRDITERRDALVQGGDTLDVYPKFHHWRRRQIARAYSELGGAAVGIVHPIFAFELSKGCSVGCWFCGISAARFGGYYPYTAENADLWKDILSICTSTFGDASKSAFCYWATDPTDNPHYARFIEDFATVVGVLPQTTTAAPLRNPSEVRAVLALADRYPSMPNRFSILTTKLLRRVHAEYSAEELLRVELVLQNEGAVTSKALAGRAAASSDAEISETVKRRRTPEISVEGTIACVTGFLVNMVTGVIRLVSPCKPSKEWPDGYITFGERKFKDAVEFRSAIVELIDENVDDELDRDSEIRLRRDLSLEEEGDGFILKSKSSFQVFPIHATFGRMLLKGLTPKKFVEKACESDRNVFEALDFLDVVFHTGILEDRHEAKARREPKQADL